MARPTDSEMTVTEKEFATFTNPERRVCARSQGNSRVNWEAEREGKTVGKSLYCVGGKRGQGRVGRVWGLNFSGLH
jgi:hypothetical protein